LPYDISITNSSFHTGKIIIANRSATATATTRTINMDKVTQQPTQSKPQHRFKPVGQAGGDTQGASPAAYVMVDGTRVMRLDNIEKMLDTVEKVDNKDH
jgi:hypothetical protein